MERQQIQFVSKVQSNESGFQAQHPLTDEENPFTRKPKVADLQFEERQKEMYLMRQNSLIELRHQPKL